MTVQDIRTFNRFYTNLIGALDYSRQLHTPYTLTEARVLYELAHRDGADSADLRTALCLDAGYLSRLLAKFERDGLITRSASTADARRVRVELTARGRGTQSLLEERAGEAVGTLLGRVPAEERPRLAEAMATIQRILGNGTGPGRTPKPVLRAPEPGDLGWMIQRNAALYAQEYGFDAGYEALVARIVGAFAAHHDPDRERVWIAELAGLPVGAVMCVQEPESPGTARLRLLLVEPDARGHRIGTGLVDACVAFAREKGYEELVLWTNDVLTAARAIYLRAGFELVKETPHHSFGKELVGQDWRLVLK